MKHHSKPSTSGGGGSGPHGRLDDAEPDLLELKRAQLKKELELQIKMDSARGSAATASKSNVRHPGAGGPSAGGGGGSSAAAAAAAAMLLRKRKRAAARSTSSSSSSSSSGSGSDSSSDSASSSSSKRGGGHRPHARKNAKTKRHQRGGSSSGSSDDAAPHRKQLATGKPTASSKLQQHHQQQQQRGAPRGSSAKKSSSAAAAAAAAQAAHVKRLATAVNVHHHPQQYQHEAQQPPPHSQHHHRKRSPSPSQIIVRKHQHQRPVSPSPSKSSSVHQQHHQHHHHHRHRSGSSGHRQSKSGAAASASGRSEMPLAYMDPQPTSSSKSHRSRQRSEEALMHEQQIQQQQHHHHHHREGRDSREMAMREREREHEREQRERHLMHREHQQHQQQQHHHHMHMRQRSSRSPPLLASGEKLLITTRLRSRSPPPPPSSSSKHQQRRSRSREIRGARSPQSTRGSLAGTAPGGPFTGGRLRERTPDGHHRSGSKREKPTTPQHQHQHQPHMRHEDSREMERDQRGADRRSGGAPEALSTRERERMEMIRAQEQRVGRERERYDRGGGDVGKVASVRSASGNNRERDQQRDMEPSAERGSVKSTADSRLLPRPAERAMAMALAARSREGSEEREQQHHHHHHQQQRRSRSLSRSGQRTGDRGERSSQFQRDAYAERERLERMERYEHAESEHSGIRYAAVRVPSPRRGEERDDRDGRRSSAGGGEREYMVVRMRTREDSRGRLIEEMDPYAPREMRPLSRSERERMEMRQLERERGATGDAYEGRSEHERYEERRSGGGRSGLGVRGEREPDYVTSSASSRFHHHDVPAHVDDQRPTSRAGGSDHHRHHHRSGDRGHDRSTGGGVNDDRGDRSVHDWHGAGGPDRTADDRMRSESRMAGSVGRPSGGSQYDGERSDRGRDWERSSGAAEQQHQRHESRDVQHRHSGGGGGGGGDDKWNRSSGSGGTAANIGRDSRGPWDGERRGNHDERSGLHDMNTSGALDRSMDRSGGGGGSGTGGWSSQSRMEKAERWDDPAEYHSHHQQQQQTNHQQQQRGSDKLPHGHGMRTATPTTAEPAPVHSTPFSRAGPSTPIVGPGTPNPSGSSGGSSTRRWPGWRAGGNSTPNASGTASSPFSGAAPTATGSAAGGATALGARRPEHVNQFNQFRGNNMSQQEGAGSGFGGHQSQSPFRHGGNLAEKGNGSASGDLSVRSLMSLSTVKPPPQSQLTAGDDKPPTQSTNPFSSIPTLASVAPAMYPKGSDVAKIGAATVGLKSALLTKDTRRGGDNDDEDNLSEISDDADEILNRQEEAAAAAAAAAVTGGLAGVGHFGIAQQLSVNSGGFKPALLPTPAFKVGELPLRYIVPTMMPSHAGLHHHHHAQQSPLQQQHHSLHQQQHQPSPLSAGPHHAHNHGHFMTHGSAPSSAHLNTNLLGHTGSSHIGGGSLLNRDKMNKHDLTAAIKPSAAANLATDVDLADLDFEDVSDGELEEEARIRRLGDALGVDWASLVDESRARARRDRQLARPAKQRWQAHRILLDVGVSFRRAGAEYASDVLNEALRQLRRDEAAETERLAREAQDAKELAVAKAEPKDTVADGGVQIKREIVDGAEVAPMKEEVNADEAKAQTAAAVNVTGDDRKDVAEAAVHVEVGSNEIGDDADGIQLFHPIACVQVASRASAEAGKRLVQNCTGTYSRALCAERDVALRRQLCGLSEVACGNGVNVTRSGDGAKKRKAGGSFAAIARQLFEASLANVAAY